jgi:UDP:flavonoid glycosyltransferase YjiC (YdhE family)
VRIVLTCWGSLGDFYPFLALAVRLKDMGHQPVMATCEFYRERTAAAGIRFYPVRPDIDPDDSETIRRVMDPARGTEVILRELLVPHLRDAFEDLSVVARNADVLVSHPVTFAAPLVAGVLRIRWLSVVLAPTSFFSVHDFPLLLPHPGVTRVARLTPWTAAAFLKIAQRITSPWTAPIRAFRDELRLPDRGDPLYAGQFSPFGTLALFSPTFGPPQPDWPTATVATGFVFPVEDAAPPPAITSFLDEGEAPIVFTLGSSAVGAAGSFYDESADAAEAVGRRAILLAGRDPRNRPRKSLPRSMLAAEYVSHAALFPRAAAVVHHGGIGTTAAALRAGRPMLIVPHAHDQPDNAHRAEQLGVARVLDARRYRADRAARQLRALLTKPSYQSRAREIAEQIGREAGVRTAADTIAAHASSSGRIS